MAEATVMKVSARVLSCITAPEPFKDQLGGGSFAVRLPKGVLGR